VRPARLASTALAALALTLMTGGTVAAAPYTLGPDVKVSGGSTLNDSPFGASEDFAAAYDNSEVEPQVSVDPTNPAEITGVSQHDRWPDGGARGLTSWMSTDGATSWAKLADVPWSACQGGPARFGRVTDPWDSYDKAGTLYFIGQPIDSAALGISAITVTTWNSTSWRPPQVVMAKSTDGGRHWSGPTIVATSGPNVQSYNPSIEVTQDGTVVLTHYVLGDGIATTDVWLRHSHTGGRRGSRNSTSTVRSTTTPHQSRSSPRASREVCSSATTWVSRRSRARA
jgi:hypothetical protein